MKKGIKIFLISVVSLTLLVAGSLYYVSTKLSPDEIKQLVIKGVERALPGSTLNISKVSYGLGPSISFQIDQFDLKLKSNEPGANLFSVDKVFVKIPIWAIFNGGGEINVSLSSPSVNYYEYQSNLNNWQKAYLADDKAPSKQVQATKNQKTKKSSNKLTLPTFLAASKINLRMDYVNLFYQTKSDLKGEYQVRKFLVKNLSLNTAAAFEIQSQLKMQQEGENLVSSELLLIGEVETSKLIEKGVLNSKIELKLNKFESDKVPYKIPDISSSILLTNENDIPKLSVKSSLGELGTLYSEVLLGKFIKFEKLNLELVLDQVAKLLGTKVKGLNLSGVNLKIAGDLALKNNKPIANLNFNTTKQIDINLFDPPAKLNLTGSFTGKSVRSEVKFEGLSGKAELFAKTVIPSDYAQASLDTIRNTRMRLTASKLKFSQEQVSSFLYASSDAESDAESNSGAQSKAETTDTADNKVALEKEIFIPEFLLNITARDILVDKTKLDVFSEVAGGKGKIASKDLKLNVDKGKIEGKFISRFISNDIKTNLDFKASKLNLESFNFLLPTFISSVKGSGTIKLSGNVNKLSAGNSYSLKLYTDLVDGELSKVKINDFLEEYVEKIPVLNKKISKKDINVSEKFKRLKMSAELTENRHLIKSFDFQGIGNKVIIKADADVKVPRLKEKSVVNISLTDASGELGKKLKREVGATSLPIRLDGIGYGLSPNYEYTAKKLAKTAVKTKGKKVLKKQAEKAVDKLLKGKGQEEAKKLLKGLFK